MSRRQTYNAPSGNQTRARTFGVVAYLFANVALAATVFAAPANASPITEADASTLGPGDYRWDPSLAPNGPTVMVVKLDTQRAFVWRSEKLIGITIIASGKPGYETPDGTFTVLEKEKFHRSNKYDDAPMPYMQRLTWSGLALHGGNPRGYPASHGCIRLPLGFAAALFREDTRGMKVVIIGHAPERGENLMASRQKPASPQESDDRQAAQYPRGKDEGNAPDESPYSAPAAATPIPSAASQGVESSETGEQSGNGYDPGTVNDHSDQRPDSGQNNSYEQHDDDSDRSQDVPPPDLPPPPN